MTSAVSRSSSSRPRGALRRVERCWPSAAQARRSETDSVRRTCSTQARRRAGPRSFPARPPPGSACPRSSPRRRGGDARSPLPGPSAASPGPTSAPRTPAASGNGSPPSRRSPGSPPLRTAPARPGRPPAAAWPAPPQAGASCLPSRSSSGPNPYLKADHFKGGGSHATTVAESLTATGFEIRAQIVWAKDRLVLGRGHYHWQHEPCWYAVRGTGHWSGDRKQTTLWQIASKGQDADTVHGTQKPVECMRRPIENNSSPGQAVYEPFCGSGTTVIAAEMGGRACHATELSPGYVDVAVKRWQAFTGRQAMLDGDGRPFKEIAAERGGNAGRDGEDSPVEIAEAAP